MNGRITRWRCCALVAAALFCLAGAAIAQENSAASAEAQANNPLANFTAFNIHNYYIGDFTDPEGNGKIDEYGNQFWARYARPFSIGSTNWLMRASLPVNTFPVAPELNHKTSIGDFNIFAAYLFDTAGRGYSFGLGPQITAPTSTCEELGSEKWSAGLVNTLFVYRSRIFQYGYLLSWQGSFAGNDRRADVNLGGFQPFLFLQLGHGTYLRSTGVCSYNFESGDYSVPVGLGIGQVIPREKVVFNLFVEPQYAAAYHGPGWPRWQVFIGLNTQFK